MSRDKFDTSHTRERGRTETSRPPGNVTFSTEKLSLDERAQILLGGYVIQEGGPSTSLAARFVEQERAEALRVFKFLKDYQKDVLGQRGILDPNLYKRIPEEDYDTFAENKGISESAMAYAIASLICASSKTQEDLAAKTKQGR